MGLRIWLPLLNNLDNKGISNFNITSVESSPTYVEGKIGKCYQRANSSSQLTNGLKIDNNLVDLFGSTASVTVWVKPLGTHTHYNGTILSSGNWNAKKWAFGVSQDNTKVDVLCGSYNNYITCAVPINEWTHLASIYDNGVCTLYKNGIYIGQLTGQAAFVSDADWTGVGRETYAGGYFGFNGCIADLRVFDHCLSAAEVREISQGLVLHYKLDGIRPNYILNSSGVFLTNLGSADGSRAEYRAKTLGQNLPIASGTTITISFDLHMEFKTANPYLYVYNTNNKGPHQTINGINALAGRTVQVGDIIDERISVTGTITDRDSPTQTTDFIEFYSNYGSNNWFSISNIKLEIGNNATPYIPAEMNLPNIIEDSSGYNHNGTITGTISIDSDSPRYKSSTYVNGSSYILTPAGSFAWNDLTQLTFCTWMKPTASMTGWRGSVGIAADANQTARGIAITDYGNEFRGTYTNGSGYQTVATGKTLTQNEWHHCAGTLNGTEFKLYFDGVLVKTQTIDWGTATLNANARFEVGVDLPGTDEKFTGNYSDVRCYCTALDADAIRQLYEVGAKVDNKNQLHAFEFIEPNEQEITKYGQVKAQNILETYLPLYDKTIYEEPDGSQWIHIFHHNNPTNSKFNEPTLDWTTGKYLDADRWYDVDQAVYHTLGPYEFLYKQKTTSSAAETKYRWIQTANPLTAIWADVKPGTITANTSSGYSACQGGLYPMKNSSLHMCIANGTNGNWYGGIGAAAAYQGGIPGYPNTVVTSGCIDLYLRVYSNTKIIKNVGISSAEFIEL